MKSRVSSRVKAGFSAGYLCGAKQQVGGGPVRAGELHQQVGGTPMRAGALHHQVDGGPVRAGALHQSVCDAQISISVSCKLAC
eukprot:gene10130-biopygen3474